MQDAFLNMCNSQQTNPEIQVHAYQNPKILNLKILKLINIFKTLVIKIKS